MSENIKMSKGTKVFLAVCISTAFLLLSSLMLSACNMNNNNVNLISRERAEEIVLNHAGVSKDALTRYRIEKDFDDGRQVYDVGFRYSGFEYEYEVDAQSGEIIKYDKESDKW